MTTPNIVNIIFGMKVRRARQDKGLSLSKFASRCELSPSYLTEIEKGRKYPKIDKIMKMAQALNKDYDDLVSIKLDPSLNYLETLLSSPLLSQFPYEEFDLEMIDLLDLFTRAPDKASALLRTMLEIGRQYNMKEEHFLRAALRSYQEIHENYFQDLEDAATKFTKKYKLKDELPLQLDSLKKIIVKKFGYQLDDTHLIRHPLLTHYRSVFIPGNPPKLLLNAALQDQQIKFLLARELGYQYLKIKNRANTSAPDRVDSFQQVLNDFKASYFAGSLMMPRSAILEDLQTFFDSRTWNPNYLLQMLLKYNVTPEMLFYRFSELIPQFFGLKLHFLRFHNVGEVYQLAKQFNMSNFLLPSGLNLHEHLCRRWLSVRLLKEREVVSDNFDKADTPLVQVQISEFLESHEQFLNFGFARPLALTPDTSSSVVIGFKIDADLKHTIHFLEDTTIPVTIINATCQRCSLTQDQCQVRAAPPTILSRQKNKAEREMALDKLIAQLRS